MVHRARPACVLNADRQQSARHVFRWIGAVAGGGGLTSSSSRSRAFAAMHGLRQAADSLDACVHGLAVHDAKSVDVEQLCSVSYSAGRVVGYLEALSATDAVLARQAASELGDVMASVDAVKDRLQGSTPTT